MSTSYKGLTIPEYSDPADGPTAFSDFIDSGPIPRFADVAARNAAIASPVAGQMTYTSDAGFQVYDGSSWVAFPSSSGSIGSRPTAGVVGRLFWASDEKIMYRDGGGSWERVSIEGLIEAAGDILYGTGANALARLPKGAAGQVLTMNSGATAPEWANSASPTVVRKTADETTSSSTPQEDDHLTFSVENGEVWVVEYVLFGSGATANAYLTTPTGTTGRFALLGVEGSTASTGAVRADGGALAGGSLESLGQFIGSGVSVDIFWRAQVYLEAGGSGSVTLGWSAAGGTVTMRKGSHLIARQLA